MWSDIQSIINVSEKRDVWVIGGVMLWVKLWPYVEELHHTRLSIEAMCDTFINLGNLLETKNIISKHTEQLSDRASVDVYRLERLM